MEVKEVFSLGPPICEFQFVALKDANSWDGAYGRISKIALFPFYLIRIPTMWRFRSHTKMRRKLDL
jgi:hypothetical protein